jgi:hypothetical protein
MEKTLDEILYARQLLNSKYLLTTVTQTLTMFFSRVMEFIVFE